eukprot:308171-Rhodomonas_salina.3
MRTYTKVTIYTPHLQQQYVTTCVHTNTEVNIDTDTKAWIENDLDQTAGDLIAKDLCSTLEERSASTFCFPTRGRQHRRSLAMFMTPLHHHVATR